MKEYLRPKKSLGQHWLTDPGSLKLIIDMAEIEPSNVVIEIGPGTGALTKLLTKKASQVIAIELDGRLANYLDKLSLPNLKVENVDVLEFNFDSTAKYKVIANIPYYLTGKIIRKISELKNRPTMAVLLVQKEIADRLSAQPGDLSVLGLTAQYFWQIEKGPLISPDKFVPPPKVNSMVVKLTPKTSKLSEAEQLRLFRLIKIGFKAKRKTLLNNLAGSYNLDKEKLAALLTSIGIEPNRRPQTLALDEWLRLNNVLI